ncbi:MAG: M23 family metallopeptidase [Acidobacteriota bacterium]
MRLVIAFLIGCVAGALTIFLYLQTTGRIVPRTVARIEGPQAGSPALPSATDTGETSFTPFSRPAPRSVGSNVTLPARIIPIPAGALVIPVLGMRKEDLHDNFADLRGGSRPHEALDIMAPRGTPVVAMAQGTIRKLFLSAAGGITIYEQDPTATFIYYYAHLDRYVEGLHEGQPVVAGQLLGFVGSTGNAAANAPHLHFALQQLPPTKEWWKGTAIDPYPILMNRGVTIAQPAQ